MRKHLAAPRPGEKGSLSPFAGSTILSPITVSKTIQGGKGRVQAGLTLTSDLKRDSRSLKSVSIRILPVLLHTHPQEKDVYRVVLAEEMLFLVSRGRGSTNFPQESGLC